MSGGLAPTVLFIISVIHPVLNGGKVVKKANHDTNLEMDLNVNRICHNVNS